MICEFLVFIQIKIFLTIFSFSSKDEGYLNMANQVKEFNPMVLVKNIDNKEKLENLINEKKLSKRVKLVGYRTDMHEVLQTADAFAFPSIREGLGVAAVEALACGVPLIVADNRGTREYAVDRKNSIVCNAKESESFKQAIEELSTNEALYKHLKSNCRETADYFSDKETEKVMKNVYIRADKKVREQ